MPDDLDGVAVAFARGGEAGGLLERTTEARAVAVGELTDADGAVAADEWLLDDLNLRATGVELSKHQHVMATPLGENAWLSAPTRREPQVSGSRGMSDG